MNKLDIDKIRNDFPTLSEVVNNKPLVYLDNAATTQKPRAVIEAIENYYRHYNSNIHRGVHALSQKSTEAYENSREKIRQFINAQKIEEIIFTRGATEALNLIVSSYGRQFLKAGDEVLISNMEHHANIVPWQLLAQEKDLKLRVIPINDNGELILEDFDKMLNEKTKIVSLVHISNTLGTINPIQYVINKAKEIGAITIIDAAQSIQHKVIDVQKLDCDFLVFSGHKLYGPTGTGILYGKYDLLDKMPPYQSGGDMIKSVSFERTLFNDLPHKFEAGTPHIAGNIALGYAIDYIQSITLEAIDEYENYLLDYATNKLSEIDELKIIGTAKNKASVVSFVINNVHPHDIGTLLDADGIAVRTGHHCTEPIMKRFGIPATSRASFSFYNTIDEINVLYNSILKIIKIFK
ncbi:MAG TPA: cysteine desulfurase [Candidatus Kapabacteria bacterium]|nr:cysteine desulfurase [Candidatus Kapabacteria bacterium]